MLSSLMCKLLLVMTAVLLLTAIVLIYFRSKNVNRSEFINIFKMAGYFQFRIIAFVVAFTLIFGIFNHIKSKKYVQAVLSLNYSEASIAQNSNGTRYNMSEIICDEVIAKAIEMGAFEDVTVKELKQCLSVYPYIQGGVNDKSEYHISTEFVVEYYASKHTDHLDSENVIQLITSAYKEYYVEKYTDNFKLDLPEEKPDFSQMEYMDIVSYFDKESNAILNYLYGMAGKSSSFVTQNNTTFNSIAGKVYQFKKTQIEENLKSLILQNGISKDRVSYTDRLEYRNKNTDFDRRKNFASFALCNQAIDMYSEEMTRIVLVPTWDQGGKYYMGRTKVGIDELSVMATDFSNRVASNEKEIMDNNLIIGKMQTGLNGEETLAVVNELISSIDKSIAAFGKEAITAGREFSNHRMNQCIAVSINGISLLSELKTIIFFGALLYAALMLYVISGRFPRRR